MKNISLVILSLLLIGFSFNHSLAADNAPVSQPLAPQLAVPGYTPVIELDAVDVLISRLENIRNFNLTLRSLFPHNRAWVEMFQARISENERAIALVKTMVKAGGVHLVPDKYITQDPPTNGGNDPVYLPVPNPEKPHYVLPPQ